MGDAVPSNIAGFDAGKLSARPDRSVQKDCLQGAALNWRARAKLFWLFQLAPGGRALYYLAQRYVTRTLPRPASSYEPYLQDVRRRRDQLAMDGPLSGKVMLEFGAGWDLFHNIGMYCYGLDRQIVVDLNPYMRFDLVNDVIAAFRKNPRSDFARLPPAPMPGHSLETLKTIYGIDYRAPTDARSMAIADGGIDFVATSNTLEHIPFGILEEIMRECGRVCKPDGLLCMRIDYSDHYSHSDAGITPYNFLRFSEQEWRRYNPPNHYQNRKRHADYRQMFERLGFEILKDEAERPDNWREMLGGVQLHPDFSGYAHENLAATAGLFVMRPPTLRN